MSTHVLLIEDNPGDARFIEEMLKEAGGDGFTVECATRLSDGLEKLSSNPADVVLLDLSLPDSRGLETLVRFQSKFPKLPAVILTGLNDEETAVQAAQAGAQDYFVKGTIAGPALGRSLKYAIERKKAQETIRLQGNQYAALISTTSDGYWYFDGEGKLLDVNDTYCQMSGYSRDELLHMRIDELEGGESHERLLAHIQAIVTKGFDRFETQHRKKNGELFDVEISATSLQATGQFLSFARDITWRNRAEEARTRLESQLLQAQKMEAVGRLAGGVSHDFNNIMSIVIGYSDLIAETLSPSDLNLGRIMKIKDAGRRASALISQLLAFSRLQVFAPTLMDLNASITHLAEMLPRLLGEDIQIILPLDQNLWTVQADPSQIDQVLLNLAVNARDAMPQGGKLVIETHNVELDESCSTMHPDVPPGSFAMICVSDTGTGISSEAMPHIFDPFFTTKEMGKGTGLGLSTVYGIVRQSGGFISVDTKVPGGTTFKIYLPRQGGLPTVAAPKRENARPKTVAAKRILLAEDDAALRELVSIQLEGLGYTVLAASNGGEALRMAEKQEEPIDLLLTDMVMPGMSGRQLADRLKQKIPALKVLFVSGYSGDVISREGSLEPGTYFVHKPFTETALDEKLRSIFSA